MRTATTVLLATSALLLAACGSGGGEPGSDPAAPERLSPVRAMTAGDTEGFARAVEPRDFVFPADHGPHPGFRLEWWYLVGHLDAEDGGRTFGYQLTLFRQALASAPPERPSAWAAGELYMAHFALTDVAGGRFHSDERFSRGAAGLAGARTAPFRVWLDDWSIASEGESSGDFFPLRLRARTGEVSLDLVLDAEKPLVLQGDGGLSRKGPTPGNASYYYSFTRLAARGTVGLAGADWPVAGSGWLDREWSTSGLEPDQVGWDWFALQLDDGRDLMFYQLRLRDGSIEPLSHGILVAADGASRHLSVDDVELAVLATWRSPGGTVYPGRWRLRIPAADLDLTVEPLLAEQELDVTFRYWEGAVATRGTAAGEAVTGRGYVELVGYADADPVVR